MDLKIKKVKLGLITNEEKLSEIENKVNGIESGKVGNEEFESHTTDTNNPHNVTKEQVGLNNVDNTSDLDKPISTATQVALNNKVNTTDLGNYITTSTANSTFVTKEELGNIETILDNIIGG